MSRKEHAMKLAARHGVVIEVVDDPPCPPVSPGTATGTATGNLVLLHLPRGWTHDAYIAALHEIAHCALEHVKYGQTTAVYRSRTLACEVEAWKWAFDNAEYPVGRLSRQFALDCASTYARDYGDEGNMIESFRAALNI